MTEWLADTAARRSATTSACAVGSPVSSRSLHVSRTVSVNGRQVSPAAAASLASTCHVPGMVRHSGISDHCRTPSRTSSSSGTHTGSVSDPVTCRHASSIPPNVSRPIGAATLNAPLRSCSMHSSVNAARSRTSTG